MNNFISTINVRVKFIYWQIYNIIIGKEGTKCEKSIMNFRRYDIFSAKHNSSYQKYFLLGFELIFALYVSPDILFFHTEKYIPFLVNISFFIYFTGNNLLGLICYMFGLQSVGVQMQLIPRQTGHRNLGQCYRNSRRLNILNKYW